MSRIAAAATIAALSLTVGACGSGNTSTQDTSGAPPFTVPTTASASASLPVSTGTTSTATTTTSTSSSSSNGSGSSVSVSGSCLTVTGSSGTYSPSQTSC